MNTDLNGKKIKMITWPDSEQESGRHLPAGEQYGWLTLSATCHGDNEFWVVQSKDGKEIARHNPKYLESIVWADE